MDREGARRVRGAAVVGPGPVPVGGAGARGERAGGLVDDPLGGWGWAWGGSTSHRGGVGGRRGGGAWRRRGSGGIRRRGGRTKGAPHSAGRSGPGAGNHGSVSACARRSEATRRAPSSGRSR